MRSKMMLVRRGAWAAPFALLLGIALASPAPAVTLLDVGGLVRFNETVDFDEAVAAAFTLDSAYNGVAISVPTATGVNCVSCAGEIFLMRNAIGPAALESDLVATSAFTGGTSLFSGLDLAAGTYFVVLSNDAGALTWPAMLSANVTAMPGVSYGGWYQSDRDPDPAVIDLADFVPQSDFSLVGGNTGLRFEVTAIPEPTTLALLLGGVTALAGARRRGRRS